MLKNNLIFKSISDLLDLAGDQTYLVIMSGYIIVNDNDLHGLVTDPQLI